MNRNTTLVLVGAFGLLLLYFIFVQRPADEAALNATPTPGARGPLWVLTAEQIAGIQVTDRANQKQVVITKNADGTWQVDGQPADETRLPGLVSQIAGLSYSTIVTPLVDLSAYGVLSPTYTFDLTLTDGTHRLGLVGHKAPTGTAYYVQRSGEGEVFLINTAVLDSLIGLVDAPPYFIPTPTVAPTVDLVATLLAPPASTTVPNTATSVPTATP